MTDEQLAAMVALASNATVICPARTDNDRFIAAARQFVPDAIAEIRRLRLELSAANEQRDRLLELFLQDSLVSSVAKENERLKLELSAANEQRDRLLGLSEAQEAIVSSLTTESERLMEQNDA